MAMVAPTVGIIANPASGRDVRHEAAHIPVFDNYEKSAIVQHDPREVFDALRWLVRAGAPWRMLPNDLASCYTVYQQTKAARLRAALFKVHSTLQGENACYREIHPARS